MRDQVAAATNRRTGATAEAWRVLYGFDGSAFVATVINEHEKPRPEWLDEGTPPHRIDGNPLLSFYWPKVGRVVVFRHVNHPGYGGSHFAQTTLTAERWRDSLVTAQARL